MDGPTNNFVGPFNAHGNNITVVDGAGFDPGQHQRRRQSDVTSSGGDISQSRRQHHHRRWHHQQLDAGSSNITLDSLTNNFVGPFNAHGNNITVVDGAGGLVLGNVSAGGNLM
ncbi:MAG: hypothetical protein KF778_14965 [Rhodocyclaceae bacterium]|nr:hypothetical protein [Rhodocyclaceae bacterium]